MNSHGEDVSETIMKFDNPVEKVEEKKHAESKEPEIDSIIEQLLSVNTKNPGTLINLELQQI